MSIMAANVEFLALVFSKTLADALLKVAARHVRVQLLHARQRKRRARMRKPLVCFREIPLQGPAAELSTAAFGYAVSIGLEPGVHQVPPGTAELIMEPTARKLARRIRKQIRDLEDSADQRILRVRRSPRGTVEVLFLDGEMFDVRVNDGWDWDKLSIASDRRYFIVPRHDGSTATVPWDGIRRPEAHLDEERRSRERLAQTIRALRNEARLTQDALARASGLSRQTINRLERAGHYPGLETLRTLARGLGVDLRELLDRLAEEG